jgi:hypothetical protein
MLQFTVELYGLSTVNRQHGQDKKVEYKFSLSNEEYQEAFNALRSAYKSGEFNNDNLDKPMRFLQFPEALNGLKDG